MQVKRLEAAEAPLELIDRLAGNNFFCSTSFAGIWTTLGGRPVYWVAEESGQVVGVLPGVEFGRGIFRRFQSMPDGCYASLLIDQSSDPKEISGAISAAILQEGYLKAFVNDFHKSFQSMPGYKNERCLTYLVNISSKEWEPLDSKLRQQIHKGERSELDLQKFDSNRHLDAFMKLVSMHEQRRSVKVRYTREFFQALADVSVNDNRVKWIWCEHDGKAVSSHIFIIEGESILHWQMYYDETQSDLQATKFIPFKIAKEAAGQGIRTLNLGSTPEGAEGADFYKSKWGGDEFQYNCYVHKSFLGRFL